VGGGERIDFDEEETKPEPPPEPEPPAPEPAPPAKPEAVSVPESEPVGEFKIVQYLPKIEEEEAAPE
jgi:hypothetical protein